MKYNDKLETCLLLGTLFIKKNTTRDHLPQINHKYGSTPKDFNKDTDT